MRNIKTKLMADFETSTEAMSTDKAWVWAWYMTDIYKRSVKFYGNSIESFFETLFTSYTSAIVYFHNLKFDGMFIMDYIMRVLGAQCIQLDEEERDNTFTVLMNKQGIIYSIEYYVKTGQRPKTYRFLDSMKILPFSVKVLAETYELHDRKLSIDYDEYREPGHVLTEEEKAYITNDVNIVADALLITFKQGDTKMTASSNALSTYKETLGGDESFRRFFPVLPKEENEDIRKAYRGGFVYVNPNYKQRVMNGVMVYDKNSMYPSQMRTKMLPYGVPRFFTGEFEGDEPLYIQHIQCNFTIKPGYVPFIQLRCSGFLKTEYVRDSNRAGQLFQDLYLTNIELPIFLEHYDVRDLEYVNGYAFKGGYNLFNAYIDHYYNVKQHNKGALRQQAKLKLNSLYGKFATNVNSPGKVACLEEPPKTYANKTPIVSFKDSTAEDKRDPVYTPMGVFITSYARADLMSVIDALGGEKEGSLFIYCDTDSVHIRAEKSEEEISKIIPIDDTGKLNFWKCEGKPCRGYFIGAKTYIEEYEDGSLNIRAAGMPANVKKEITFDNFRVGFTSQHKLQPHVVEGGVLLESRDFKLKERSFRY